MGQGSGGDRDWKNGVLSPRVQGVVSAGKVMNVGSRRTTMGGFDGPGKSHSRAESMGMTVGERAAMRLSSATPMRTGGNDRGSLMPGKSVWR
jgi:hypothetical protein